MIIVGQLQRWVEKLLHLHLLCRAPTVTLALEAITTQHRKEDEHKMIKSASQAPK